VSRVRLTARQRAVLTLIVRGYTTNAIATRLRIKATTVAYHRRKLMRALGAHRKSQLVIRAHRLSYV
jgi:DNA-binding NarL/FixJ family response regulator